MSTQNKSFRIAFLSYLGQAVLTLLFRTNRFIVEGAEHIQQSRESGRPLLMCSWHGRVMYGSYWIYRNKLRPWTVASRHGDGEILARIVKRWGYKLIRGSSNKGGMAVLRKMNEVFKTKDNIVALTSDGPKGPIHVAKPGSISLARRYNADIIAVSGTSTRYWEFNSWDKFRIPKPFGTVKIRIAKPLVLPADEDLSQADESRIVSEYLSANQEKGDQI